MKKELLSTLLASLMAVTPACAGTTSTTTVQGAADPTCAVSNAPALTFGTLVNATTGATAIQTANPSVDITAFCNGAQTTVTVTRTNLVAQGVATPAAPFTNTVPVLRVLVTTPQNSTGVTDQSTITSGTSTGTNGQLGPFTKLTVQAFSGSPSGSLVASGNYSGTVTINLSTAK